MFFAHNNESAFYIVVRLAKKMASNESTIAL